MRTAHLILTCTSPEQTERGIRKCNVRILNFISIWIKRLISRNICILSNIENVFFIKNRINVRWAGYNTVKAVFNSIQEICDTCKSHNFINLLRGQDYPLKSATQLACFLEKIKGKNLSLITIWLIIG